LKDVAICVNPVGLSQLEDRPQLDCWFHRLHIAAVPPSAQVIPQAVIAGTCSSMVFVLIFMSEPASWELSLKQWMGFTGLPSCQWTWGDICKMCFALRHLTWDPSLVYLCSQKQTTSPLNLSFK
jgi:hypothetical protein